MAKYDTLIESLDGHTFQLVRGDDEFYSVADVVKSEALAELLGEVGLSNSFIATYVGQLALTGGVDKLLLLCEGEAMQEELTMLYGHIEKTDENGSPLNFATSEWPADKLQVWLSLLSPIKVVSREGYSDSASWQFYLQETECQTPTTIGAFVSATALYEPMQTTVGEWIAEIDQLADNPAVTHWIEQAAISRDASGMSVDISDSEHMTVGSLNARGEFVPYATILKTFNEQEPLFSE